jgi:hypothetical protein
MEAIIISKKSLLWRLATSYGSLSAWEQEDTDLCTVTKAWMRGLLIILLMIIVSVLLLLPLMWISIAAVYWMVNGVVGPLDYAYASAAIYALFVGVIGIIAYRDYRMSHYRESKPTILSEAWKSIKEKTCVRIRAE